MTPEYEAGYKAALDQVQHLIEGTRKFAQSRGGIRPGADAAFGVVESSISIWRRHPEMHLKESQA